ncbi:MAG: glycosyltransferase, partial [Chloroflexi bacterium]|nr:glycosyltransferase [Chloroflexota bacterium]
MNILHIYKDYFPVVGGMENHIKLLAEAQAARGHNVSVLVTSHDHRTHIETVNGVRVIFAARLATISSAPISIALPQLLARERPDIAHLHFPYPLGEAAQFFFGHARKVVITYQSDIVRQKYLRVLYAPLMRRVLARADHIIASSPNYIRTSPTLRAFESKCVVVPLGIDPTPFENPLSRSESHASRITHHASLLFVGHLRYYKGVNYLIEAMRELPTARLTIVGSGMMERAWKNLARDLGIESRIVFVGEVPDAQLPDDYAACDIFVLPSSE